MLFFHTRELIIIIKIINSKYLKQVIQYFILGITLIIALPAVFLVIFFVYFLEFLDDDKGMMTGFIIQSLL